MTPSLTKSHRTRRSARLHAPGSARATRSHPRRTLTKQRGQERSRRLARYLDGSGRPREVISRPGLDGSVLVVDREADTRGDRRLVAHLGGDEPRENAAIVCEHYLADGQPSAVACRPLSAEDLRTRPFAEEEAVPDWPARGALNATQNKHNPVTIPSLSGLPAMSIN